MRSFRGKIVSVLVAVAMVISINAGTLVSAAATTTLKTKSITLLVGKTSTIALNNKNKTSTYSFTSSDKSVASVSKTGVVKGVTVGTAKITVKQVDKAKKSTKVGTVSVKVKAAASTPAPTKAPDANSYSLDLSQVQFGTYDPATDSITAVGTLFNIPLKTPTKNGDVLTVTVKGTYNGSKGFRSWLIDDVQTTTSNVADASVFPSKPGAFEVTYKLTAIGVATQLFFKGPSYDAPNIDNVTIASITISQ